MEVEVEVEVEVADGYYQWSYEPHVFSLLFQLFQL